MCMVHVHVTCANPEFFSGGPDPPPPITTVGMYMGKSGALHCEMQIKPLIYNTPHFVRMYK